MVNILVHCDGVLNDDEEQGRLKISRVCDVYNSPKTFLKLNVSDSDDNENLEH